MEIARAFQYEATRNLRSNPIIRECLVWARGNQAALQERIDYVSEVSQSIVYLLESSIIPPPWVGGRTYLDPRVAELHAATKFDEIEIAPHALAEAYEAANQDDDLDYAETVQREAKKTFRTVGQKFFTTNADTLNRLAATPHTVATYLLIEGLSTFVQEYREYPDATAKIYRDTLFSIAATLFPNSEVFDDFIAILRAEEPDDLTGTTRFLNKTLRLGTPMHKLVPYLREFPQPVAVDFNNVLVNNSDPMRPNPKAPAFLESLQEIGNVFIVTSASSWEAVQERLKQYNLWSDRIVLMAFPNYRFLLDENDPHAEQLKAKYNALTNTESFSAEKERKYGGVKLIAPLFGKPWQIPMIDNDIDHIRGNPGILGIHVVAWETDPDLAQVLERSLFSGPTSLNEAVAIVRDHYSRIT